MAKSNTSNEEAEIKKVNILGSEWTLKIVRDDPAFEEATGYVNDAARIIMIEAVKMKEGALDFDLQSQYIDQKRTIRHEVLHAYLYESGLAHSSNSAENWAVNEEMVDWFARMSPKIFATYKELKVL